VAIVIILESITFLSVGILVILTLLSIFNGITAIRMEKAPLRQSNKKVSLLIPVRNEAANVQKICESISKCTTQNKEVVFLDDQSTDKTLSLLEEERKKNPAIQIVSGKPLPKRWVGKSWACYQLAQVASGEVFLFCDADVAMSSQAIERTLSWMEEKNLDSISALPLQEMKSWQELAIIPLVMQLSIFALVPLRLIPVSRRPSLVVANGQWLAMTRKAYFAVGGHESVANSLLEDMELGRKLVAQGFTLLPILATKDLRVRMYSQASALREGFTKNLFLLCGGRVWSALAVGCLMIVSLLWPLIAVGMGLKGAVLSLGLLIVLRLIVGFCFLAPWNCILLHPLGVLGVAHLLFCSVKAHVQGKVFWRGREVSATQHLTP
jgi:GT2 family glycosyltransferase